MHFLNEELQFAAFSNMLTINLCLPTPNIHQEPIIPQICNHKVLNYELVDKFHNCIPTFCTTIFHLIDHGVH
jgi:hypothetical protein